MACTDPREVTRLADAFDLTTPAVLQWELELIWAAVNLDILKISYHAYRAAADDAIPASAVSNLILDGVPRSKDISIGAARQIGINFEGQIPGGRWIRVKVSWKVQYTVVTVHAL